MDDIRVSNLLFLAGIASLAIPGCGDGSRPLGAGDPPGNPLEFDNSLTGAESDGDDVEVCFAYASRQLDCGVNEYDLGLQEYVQYCEYLLDYIGMYGGPDCRSAYAELLACVSTQNCDAFACSDEEEAVDRGCGGQGEGDTGG